MRLSDALAFCLLSLRGNQTRTLLMMLAMSIGVASVLLLSSLGEGARAYVINQFNSIGNNLVIVLPGRTETAGVTPGLLLGQVPREISLSDANALLQSHAVARMAPLVVGTTQLSVGTRNRDVIVLGSNHELLAIRHMSLAQGRFLPKGDVNESVIVLGHTIKQTLFGNESAIGKLIRVSDRRYRVIGILSQQGESMGFNTDEVVIVPVAAAHSLFNSSGLFRILVEAKNRAFIQSAKQDVERIMRQRHHGELDVTVITQDAVVATFDRILRTLTLAISGIAAISLLVAGVLIMNVMLIAVTQRIREIGLLKALGASPSLIRKLFFAEAALLSLFGSICGLLIGKVCIILISKFYPSLTLITPWWAIIAAMGTALLTGIIFSVWPAQRAAQLDPVLALMHR